MGGHHDKVYVLFDGRKPGVYLDWVNCKAQVNYFSGNSYIGYDTYEQAESAWITHCIKAGYGEDYARRQMPKRRLVVQQCGEGSSSQSYYGLETRTTKLAPTSDSEEFIHEVSMQVQLAQICRTLGMPPPNYTLQGLRKVNGKEYQRYYASVTGNALGLPPFFKGRFGKSDYDAREDVVAVLIRCLLVASGKKIRDYNYYNVELLEEELSRVKEENMVLHMKLATLNEASTDNNSQKGLH